MSERPLAPPRGGSPPPETAALADGTELRLRPLAEEVCRRYRGEYPDEEDRYGDAGMEWCVHDLQHLLSWAAMDATYGNGILSRQVDWLASVLGARGYPLERLDRALQLAADVVRDLLPNATSLAAALARVRRSQA